MNCKNIVSLFLLFENVDVRCIGIGRHSAVKAYTVSRKVTFNFHLKSEQIAGCLFSGRENLDVIFHQHIKFLLYAVPFKMKMRMALHKVLLHAALTKFWLLTIAFYLRSAINSPKYIWYSATRYITIRYSAQKYLLYDIAPKMFRFILGKIHVSLLITLFCFEFMRSRGVYIYPRDHEVAIYILRDIKVPISIPIHRAAFIYP